MIRRADVSRCQGCDATGEQLDRCRLGVRSLYLCPACVERLGAVREDPAEPVE